MVNNLKKHGKPITHNTMDFEKDFNHWYLQSWIPKNRPDYNKFDRDSIYRKWQRKTLSEQWGVYVDFFEEKGISIELTKLRSGWAVFINGDVDFNEPVFETRQESRKAALEQAKIIYNGSK